MKFDFVLRKASIDDYLLFQQCFDNEEFAYNIGEVDPMKIVALESPHVVLIVSILIKNEKQDIGFCSFHWQEKGSFLYLGGVLPKYFNSGYGLYASVVVLSYMFDTIKANEINTLVYHHNKRSLRMLLAIGFHKTESSDSFAVLKLNKIAFHNEFVKLIQRKIDYQV